MKNYINDSPIETIDDDSFGVTEFAKALSKSFKEIKKPIGTTIALHGPWGSGKSSVVNLVRHFLSNTAQNDGELIVSEFKCWWYRGEEALALAFLQNLHSILSTELDEKIKDLVPKLGRGLLQAGPVLSSAIAMTPAAPFSALTGAFSSFAKRFFPDGGTVETNFRKLFESLEKKNQRILIVIDDIDRLSSDEAIAIFRMVKSIGRLPNVMYLLVFDRDLAEKAIEEKYPSEGPHFLEKIIQAGFELPYPVQTDLNHAVLSAVSEICGEPEEEHLTRFMNLFYDIVVPYIELPRDVTRLKNTISVSWPAIAGEVNLGDFVALETIRLYEPLLFNTIRSNKALLCGTRQEGDPQQNDEGRFDKFTTQLPADRHDLAKLILQRLFPRLERTGYGGDSRAIWNSERRVCIKSHFETYFRLTLSDETVSSQTLSKLIANSDNIQFIKDEFRKAAMIERRNGTSLVPVYLEEISTNAKKLPKENVESFFKALFEIHDEIDLERDSEKGLMAMVNTSLRYHWLIRRLTDNRFDLSERTNIYMESLDVAALGWLVDFTTSAISDYTEKADQSSRREEDCLVSEDAIPDLKEKALGAIREAAQNGTLLAHQDLLWLLHRWHDFVDHGSEEVRNWTSRQLTNPKAAVVLAKSMTGESWSAGMGGFGQIGDRVAKRAIRAQISEDIEIVDTKTFHETLEKILDSEDLTESDNDAVRQFLRAWDLQAQAVN